MAQAARSKRPLSSSSSGSNSSVNDQNHVVGEGERRRSVYEPGTKSSRFTASSPSSKGATGIGTNIFSCTLPPTCSPSHPSHFDTNSALSGHYESHHAHVCSQCHRMFPSELFLNLHIDEHHNVLTDLKREKGDKVYKCFEPACTRRFSTPKTRRLHLVDLHKYPRQFFFSLPKHGLNQLFERYGPGASLIRPDWRPRQEDASLDSSSPESVMEALPAPPSHALRPTNIAPSSSSEGESQSKAAATAGGVDDLSQQLERTKLDMVPKQVKFGQKRGGKSGFRGR